MLGSYEHNTKVADMAKSKPSDRNLSSKSPKAPSSRARPSRKPALSAQFVVDESSEEGDDVAIERVQDAVRRSVATRQRQEPKVNISRALRSLSSAESISQEDTSEEEKPITSKEKPGAWKAFTGPKGSVNSSESSSGGQDIEEFEGDKRANLEQWSNAKKLAVEGSQETSSSPGSRSSSEETTATTKGSSTDDELSEAQELSAQTRNGKLVRERRSFSGYVCLMLTPMVF